MNRLRSLSASVVALVAAGALSLQSQAQTRPGTWFSLQSTSRSPLREQIERLATDGLGRASGTLSYSAGTSTMLSATLASRASTDLTFVAGRAADITEYVRNDPETVQRLKLEIVNARLGAAPFYLFTNGEKVSNLRQPSPRVLYVSRVGDLQPNDVAALIAKMPDIQPPAVLEPLNSPNELARRLFVDHGTSGAVDVVGIYDEDPSPFLHQFLTFYEAYRSSSATARGRQQLIQMVPLPTGTTGPERDGLQTDRLQRISGSLVFLFVRFDDEVVDWLDDAVPGPKDGILAVSATRGDLAPDSLWVLSNVRRVAGEAEYQRVRRLLGDASFVALMASGDFQSRCESAGAQYSAYLLDAQLGDRENRAKALAFWSDVVLRSTTAPAAEAARLNKQGQLVQTALRQRLNVDTMSKEGRADLVSRLTGPRGTKRELFSDADGGLFKLALSDIQAALRSNDPAVRSKQFSTGRAKLLAIVEKGTGVTCHGKDNGLFGRGLDPYFSLGLVDAYAALEKEMSRIASSSLPR